MNKLVIMLSAAVLLAFILVGCATPAQANEAEDSLVASFADVSDSVGALYTMSESGDMGFSCSVTAIGEYEGETILLTANHCVHKGTSYRVTFDREMYHTARVWKIPGYVVDDEKYKKAYNDPDTDMALFLTGAKVEKHIELSEDTLKVGENVIMVGFPLGRAKVYYKGFIAGYHNRPGSRLHGYQILQIFGAPGNSGSALIDLDTGKIVSVLVEGTNNRGLPVISATPISYKRYLQEVDVNNMQEADVDATNSRPTDHDAVN